MPQPCLCPTVVNLSIAAQVCVYQTPASNIFEDVSCAVYSVAIVCMGVLHVMHLQYISPLVAVRGGFQVVYHFKKGPVQLDLLDL